MFVHITCISSSPIGVASTSKSVTLPFLAVSVVCLDDGAKVTSFYIVLLLGQV